jgi:hypothetical protein
MLLQPDAAQRFDRGQSCEVPFGLCVACRGRAVCGGFEPLENGKVDDPRYYVRQRNANRHGREDLSAATGPDRADSSSPVSRGRELLDSNMTHALDASTASKAIPQTTQRRNITPSKNNIQTPRPDRN